jgi:hypothetical protein
VAVIKKNQTIAPFLGAKLNFIPGQDPMGMLNIGEQIFSMLLPGLNNVTERIRYYSFYCWFFGWYAKSIGSENPKEQRNYLRKAEYLLALMSVPENEGGIPGITKAEKNYSEEATIFSLHDGTGELENVTEKTYWKNPRGVFGQNYVSSMRQMGLIRDKSENSGIYIRTAFDKESVVTGKDLEDAFNANISEASKSIFYDTLKTSTISKEDLFTIREDFYMITVKLGSSENKLLTDFLVEVDQPTTSNEFYFRRNTIALYLDQVGRNSNLVTVQNFVNYCYSNQGKYKGVVNDTIMGWYYYQLSQYWHIVCTSYLKHFLVALQDKCDSGWYVEGNLVKELTEEVVGNLKSVYHINDNTTFEELDVLDDGNTEIVKSIHTKSYIDGFCFGLMLLKKLMIENKHTIQQQFNYAKKYKLHSSSDFVAVYNDLEQKSSLTISEFVTNFLKKYILNRHQMVALNKMNATQSTEKFLREDGYIRFVSHIDFDFSNPRLGNLITFLKNLGVISKDGTQLTTDGLILKEQLSECWID